MAKAGKAQNVDSQLTVCVCVYVCVCLL
jgi:hypothetical protein